MNDANKYSLQHADSLDELATLICGFGYYANHNDDFEHPVPKEAVREYLEVGAMFQQSRVWHPKTERPDDEGQILIDEGDGCGTAGTYYADGDMLAAAADGIAADWEDWRMDRWAYISDLVPKKEKEDRAIWK